MQQDSRIRVLVRLMVKLRANFYRPLLEFVELKTGAFEDRERLGANIVRFNQADAGSAANSAQNCSVIARRGCKENG